MLEQTGSGDGLAVDAAHAVAWIAERTRTIVAQDLKRRGLVVAMSGGVDSSVCVALAVEALGSKRVFGLLLPERDTEPAALELAEDWAKQLGIEYTVEDITSVLEACGSYAARDRAIRRLVPEYSEGWRNKIVLAVDRLNSDRLNVHDLVVETPEGRTQTVRLPPREYREVVAATNFKQRVRKMYEYYHADRLHYAVAGSPNRLEYDQGFFVKGGDGLADIKPMAHLYKTQVYRLAEYLGVPEAIRHRVPTTGTYPLTQTQEEFYFTVPLELLDRLLHAHNEALAPEQAARQVGYEPEQVARVFQEIERKRSTTRYLHLPAILVEAVKEIE